MALKPEGAPLSIANGVREFAGATPSTVAVIDGDRRLTYGELAQRARRLANRLLHDLGPGDHIAVCLGNRLEYHEVACGVAMAGMVLVPLNPRLTAVEADRILSHSDARALVVDPGLVAQLEPSIRSLGLTTLVVGATGSRDYEAALLAASPDDPSIPIDELEPFCIAYTSGTTGDPKGVMISHRSRSLTFYAAALEWGLGAGRCSIAVAPMYHGAGFAFGYAPVYTGGTVVMLRKWDPEELLRLIEQERAQSVFLVPTHAQMLRALGPEAIQRYDLSSLDTLYFNAAALPWELKQWVMKTFPGVGVHELYGSTEGGIITNLRPADMHRKPGSVGHPWFMTEVRVVSETGEPVGPGGTGELFSRSPYLMKGYYKNDRATSSCTTDDGFLTCGDLVRLDDEGYLHIVGRKTDTIVSGGINIFPREVEEVVEAHAEIVEAAVVGVPSEEWGEKLSAFVVARPGSTVTPEELDEHCRTALAGYKVPRSWTFVEALPRNAAGKVVRRQLQDRPLS